MKRIKIRLSEDFPYEAKMKVRSVLHGHLYVARVDEREVTFIKLSHFGIVRFIQYNLFKRIKFL